ncbi:transporter [Sorangium cellulosum]|uniref:Transporter n=1 Tax=Sorangium cellulosum TaxID=56 RepID=A0A2L0F091_SORCE|nr:ABC-2 family transporter protein [Sorangium cellulosum]AUX44946.1 transporter [Sorangium cellulosum]
MSQGALKLYLRLAAASLRAQMQYRASFAMWSAGQFITVGIELLGVWALFHRFGAVKGWRFEEVALLFGLVNVSFALAESFGRGFDTFSTLVRSGDFDRILLRPRSTAFQVATREFQFLRAGRLAIGLVMLGWAGAALDVGWTAPKLLLLAGAIAGGACVFYGLIVLQATLCFWTVESIEIMNAVTYGGTEAAQYPLSLYRDWFRRFFTFVVPLGFVSYIPAGALLDRPTVPALPEAARWASPLVGVVFLLVSLRIWRLGERRYQSTGS